jgi:hypothetical protein
MRSRIALIAFALAGAAGFGPAQAQLPGQGGGRAAPPSAAFGAGNVPNSSCRPLCPNDFSPCDPIYFKTEDGRCDGVMLR